jgi:hypothetical protein
MPSTYEKERAMPMLNDFLALLQVWNKRRVGISYVPLCVLFRSVNLEFIYENEMK